VEKAEQKCSALEEQLKQCHTKSLALEEKIRKINEDLRATAQGTDTQHGIARNLTLLTSELKFQLEEAQKEVDKMRNCGQDAVVNLEKEKTHTKNKLEECLALKKRITHFAKNGKGDPFQEEQLEQYKKLVRCSVCNDRLKNCVITRCFHVFCRDCINANLHNRTENVQGVITHLGRVMYKKFS